MPLTDLIRFYDRTHPIPTIPKPTAGDYSLMDEGNIGGCWRCVGDEDGDDTLQIPRPSRVPERSFWIQILVLGGGGGTELFLDNYQTPLGF